MTTKTEYIVQTRKKGAKKWKNAFSHFDEWFDNAKTLKTARKRIRKLKVKAETRSYLKHNRDNEYRIIKKQTRITTKIIDR